VAENLKAHGVVYQVGAGLGHPALITRLGYEWLQLREHGLPVEVRASTDDIEAFVYVLVRHSHKQNSESLI